MGKYIGVKYLYNCNSCRLLLQVSKKKGNSPKRNRAKRVIRHWFYENQNSIPLCDYLIFVRKPLDLSFNGIGKVIRSELDEIIRKIPKNNSLPN